MKYFNSILFFLLLSLPVISQTQDSTLIKPNDTEKTTVSGAVSVTNNGISLVPAFSLEKPAAIFDLAIRRKRFSFEPQLAFGFKDVKPWYFVFWFRYKVIETKKFNVGFGFHPGFLFNTTNFVINGNAEEQFTAARFFVGAISPTYNISDKFTIGAYYQYARGYNINLKQSQFFGLNLGISNIALGSKFYFKASPQIYYLNNDGLKGYYANANLTLLRKSIPFSISTLINTKLKSDIESKNFLWNLTLTYSY
jgi:hypothetical protein